MLKLKNLSAIVDTTPVLTDINLEINPGEIHAIMGPHGSGKSCLAHCIQGNPFITQIDGDIVFQNKNINKYACHKRSQLGIFTTFQHPPEIEGLTNKALMRSLVQSRAKGNFSNEVEVTYKTLVKSVGLDSRYSEDGVNTTSRASIDHKKGELVQALMLQPKLLILDEIDLDLDDEGLEYIVLMIKSFLENEGKSLIIITHNQKLLDYLQPNYVHIMVGGEIKEQGTTELYKRIIEDGYTQFS
jgi:Fe-S cluster assembly ATP-binding protein